MPIIGLFPSAESIHFIHEKLIEVYKEEFAPIKIESGFNYIGAVENICYIISSDEIRGKKWSHFLERVAYLFYHLNRTHPYIDGNKRTALLTTFYFLEWNGYTLRIPKDAHKILLAIADVERDDVTFEHAYNWIIKHTTVSWIDCLIHLFLVASLGFIKTMLHIPMKEAVNLFFHRIPHGSVVDMLSRKILLFQHARKTNQNRE